MAVVMSTSGLIAPSLAHAPGKNLVELADWRDLAKAGKTTGQEYIRKYYASKVSKAEGDGVSPLTLDFVITTGDVDRDQDTVAPAGWDFGNYLNNPVVLWCHSYDSFPVAKALGLTLAANAVKSRAEFTSKELQDEASHCFGYSVYRMYVEGFLNAVSVGFIPKKWVMVSDENESRRWAYDILEQELLEYSCCPVPSNPHALREAKSRGINIEPIREWAEKFMEGVAGPGMWAPKALVEQTLVSLSKGGAFVVLGGGVKARERIESIQVVDATGKPLGDPINPNSDKTIKTVADKTAAVEPDAPSAASALKGLTLASVAEVVAGVAEFVKGSVKAGARHSAADVAMIQTIHDKANDLGAVCSTAVQPADETGDAGGNVIGATAPAATAKTVDEPKAAADEVDLDALAADAPPPDTIDLSAIDNDDIDIDAKDVQALIADALDAIGQ